MLSRWFRINIVCNENIIGPRIELWGIPQNRGADEDLVWILKCLSDKRDEILFNNLSTRKARCVELKAADQLSRTKIIPFIWAHKNVISNNNAVPGLWVKYCTSTSWRSGWVTALSRIIVTSIFYLALTSVAPWFSNFDLFGSRSTVLSVLRPCMCNLIFIQGFISNKLR